MGARPRVRAGVGEQDVESGPDQEQKANDEGKPSKMQSFGTTRGTGTTLAIGCVILFILLTIALAFVAQQFR
jgi:hypothetical protein